MHLCSQYISKTGQLTKIIYINYYRNIIDLNAFGGDMVSINWIAEES